MNQSPTVQFWNGFNFFHHCKRCYREDPPNLVSVSSTIIHLGWIVQNTIAWVKEYTHLLSFVFVCVFLINSKIHPLDSLCLSLPTDNHFILFHVYNSRLFPLWWRYLHLFTLTVFRKMELYWLYCFHYLFLSIIKLLSFHNYKTISSTLFSYLQQASCYHVSIMLAC